MPGANAETSELLVPAVDGPLVQGGQPPTFSICIAAYQAASFIGDALTSLFEQTVAPYEIIVCDDGSEDDLDCALSQFLDRIKLVRQENRGLAAARNSAVARASGEFVVFLDADDVFDPRRIERLGDLARQRPDLDLLTTDAYVEFDGTIVRRFYTNTLIFETENQRTAILSSNFVFGLCAVRRSALTAIGGFEESLWTAEDWDCWMRLILNGARAGLVNEPLARYRVRAGSGSSGRVRLLQARLDVLGRALARIDLSVDERRVAGQAASQATWMLALAEAQRALADDADDARKRSWRIISGRGFPVQTRLKAMFGAIAPRAAGERLRTRRERLSTDPVALLAERE